MTVNNRDIEWKRSRPSRHSSSSWKNVCSWPVASQEVTKRTEVGGWSLASFLCCSWNHECWSEMSRSLGVEATTQFPVNNGLPNGAAQLEQQLEQLLVRVLATAICMLWQRHLFLHKESSNWSSVGPVMPRLAHVEPRRDCGHRSKPKYGKCQK